MKIDKTKLAVSLTLSAMIIGFVSVFSYCAFRFCKYIGWKGLVIAGVVFIWMALAFVFYNNSDEEEQKNGES